MAPITNCRPARRQLGFSLAELAIVFVVVALLLGGMLMPLSAQDEVRRRNDTQQILVSAREALLGFASINERLPCPATATSNGRESFCEEATGASCTSSLSVQSHGRCSNPHDGFFPAATLGFSPIDAGGYALDGWGGENIRRLRYAVTNYLYATSTTYPYTRSSGMKDVYGATSSSDIEVCSSGSQIRIPPVITAPDTSAMYCHPSYRLASDAVAVVYSLGKNAASGGASNDEKHNPNPNDSTIVADRAFVSAETGNAFDDQLIWLSKASLFNRMVASGRLP